MFKFLSSVFRYLPLAATVEGKIFCVTGGISKLITSLDEINVLNRFKDKVSYNKELDA